MSKYFFFVFISYSLSANSQNLESSVRQELSYLNLQFESLLNQKSKIKNRIQAANKENDLKLSKASQKIAQLQIEVDDLQNEVTILERNRKNTNDRSANLLDLYNNAQIEILKNQAEMNFKLWKPQQYQNQSEVNLKQFELIIENIQKILNHSSMSEAIKTQYFDETGKLLTGEVLRLGRVGAIVTEKDTSKILGPSPDGLLKVYKTTNDTNSKSINALLFQDINAKVNLRVQANLWDKFADYLPGLILFLIFSLVLGLFSFMAKE